MSYIIFDEDVMNLDISYLSWVCEIYLFIIIPDVCFIEMS